MEVMDSVRMPNGELSMWLVFRRIFDRFNTVPVKPTIALERVGGYMPGGGGNIGSAMFEFGRCYGAIVTCLHALNVPFSNPTPAYWQKAVGIQPRGKDESKEEHKRKLKRRAEELFPSAKPTLQTADAMLLAYYAANL